MEHRDSTRTARLMRIPENLPRTPEGGRACQVMFCRSRTLRATGGPRQQSEDICAAQGGKPADSATSFPFPFSRSEPGAGLHVRKIEHDPFVTQQKQQRVAGFVHEDVFAIRKKLSPVAAIPESEFSFDLGMQPPGILVPVKMHGVFHKTVVQKRVQHPARPSQNDLIRKQDMYGNAQQQTFAVGVHKRPDAAASDHPLKRLSPPCGDLNSPIRIIQVSGRLSVRGGTEAAKERNA